MAKIPESVSSLPPEHHVDGITVYWWNGEHWQEHRFVGYYPSAGAVKICVRRTKCERIVKPHEIISRERYLKYKASVWRK